jgi:hypothetical protein
VQPQSTFVWLTIPSPSSSKTTKKSLNKYSTPSHNPLNNNSTPTQKSHKKQHKQHYSTLKNHSCAHTNHSMALKSTTSIHKHSQVLWFAAAHLSTGPLYRTSFTSEPSNINCTSIMTGARHWAVHRAHTWWTRRSTPGILLLVMWTLVSGTPVTSSYSAWTLVLSLSASRSWDGGPRASASTQPTYKLHSFTSEPPKIT